MFKALIATPKAANKTMVRKTRHAVAVSSGISLAKLLVGMRQQVTAMNGVVESFGDLRLLRRAISLHGVNKALMMFANPKNCNSAIIRGLPATERLDSVGLTGTDPRVKMAIEGLDETVDGEGEKIASWLDRVSSDLGEVSDQLISHLDEIDPVLTEAKDGAASITEDSLKVTATVVGAASLKAQLETLASVAKELNVPVVDPTDAAAVNLAIEQIALLVEKVAGFTGASVVNSSVVIDEDNIEEHHEEEQKLLCDLGYTAETIGEIYDLAIALSAELRALAGRKDELLKQIGDIANFAKTVDNDVPPAVDDAIPATEAEETEESGSTTQVDVAYSLAASFVSLVSIVIESSLTAIASVNVISETVVLGPKEEEEKSENTEGEGEGEGEPKPEGGEGEVSTPAENKTEVTEPTAKK